MYTCYMKRENENSTLLVSAPASLSVRRYSEKKGATEKGERRAVVQKKQYQKVETQNGRI